MATFCITTPDPEPKRTRRQIELQIRALEGRLKPTQQDLRELAHLKEFLKGTGGSDADR